MLNKYVMFLEDVTKWVDEGSPVDIIYLDLKNYFDKVPHQRLLLKLNLNKLTKWSEKWQMLFNFGRCKCLHSGHGNEDAQYRMGGTVLNTTLKEKYLG